MNTPIRLAALALPLVLVLAACAGPRAADTQATETVAPEAVMAATPPSVAETRAWLHDFGAAYSYDVGYMEQLLDLSPGAYDAFAAGMGMAESNAHLPADAHHVATISALLADDCGQCTQLGLRMAVEDGVERDVLRQLLESPDQLSPALRLVHDYATDVVEGRNADAEAVAELRATYGDAGFAELAVNVLGVRIYPALRRAMGAETVCPPPNLDF